jgi:hypothetical protein
METLVPSASPTFAAIMVRSTVGGPWAVTVDDKVHFFFLLPFPEASHPLFTYPAIQVEGSQPVK